MLDVELHKAIRTAIKQGDVEEVIRLIGDDESRLTMMTPFGTWLHVAASAGQLEIVKRLVELGADVNAYGGISGGAALDVAASDGHYEVVKFLLDSGAALDTSEPERNPLFGAIYGGHAAIVALLIERGIDASVRYTGQSMKDMGAIEFAKERGQTEIVALLKAKGRK